MTSPAPPPGPVHQRLRQATRDAHGRLERRMPFMAPDFDLAAYRRLLGAFHGFYRPLEALLAAPAQAIAGLDWPERVKLPLLARDLRALGMTTAEIDALPPCGGLPALHERGRVLGCLYVLEGSTLGGQVVQRLLGQRLGADAGGALAFFGSYGPEVGARWRGFLRCLDAAPDAPLAEAAEQGAIDTFHALETWLQQRKALQ